MRSYSNADRSVAGDWNHLAAGPALSRTFRTVGLSSCRSVTTSARTLPKDIHPETGNRFPAIKREALNETGKKLYDTRAVADGFGPGSIGSIAQTWPMP